MKGKKGNDDMKYPIWWFGGLLGAIIIFMVSVGLLILAARLVFWGKWRVHRRPSC